MKRKLSFLAIAVLAVTSISNTVASEQQYVQVQLDDKIKLDLPSDWKTPEGAVVTSAITMTNDTMKNVNIDNSGLKQIVKILESQNKSAKVVITIKREETIDNGAVKKITLNDLKDWNSGTKDNAVKLIEKLGENVLEWEDANVRVIGNYASINYSLLRTTPNNKLNTRVVVHNYHFKDRVLTITYNYLDTKDDLNKSALEHVLRSLKI